LLAPPLTPRNFYKNSQTANPGIPAGDAEKRSEQITGRLIPVPEDGAAAEATAYVRRRRILRSCVCAQPFYFEKRTWIVPPSTALSRPSEIANRRQLGSPESDRAWQLVNRARVSTEQGTKFLYRQNFIIAWRV
jgi:hypothetical protein